MGPKGLASSLVGWFFFFFESSWWVNPYSIGKNQVKVDDEHQTIWQICHLNCILKMTSQLVKFLVHYLILGVRMRCFILWKFSQNVAFLSFFFLIWAPSLRFKINMFFLSPEINNKKKLIPWILHPKKKKNENCKYKMVIAIITIHHSPLTCSN